MILRSPLVTSFLWSDIQVDLSAAFERGPSNYLYLSLEEWPRLPFTARIERSTALLSSPLRAG